MEIKENQSKTKGSFTVEYQESQALGVIIVK
jgi:hypothetical protein